MVKHQILCYTSFPYCVHALNNPAKVELPRCTCSSLPYFAAVLLSDLYIKNNRTVHRFVEFVQYTGIDIAYAIAPHIAKAFVYMPTNMSFRLDFGYFF